MNKVVDRLLTRLSHKGLIPAEVPRLVRDVLIILNDDGTITLKRINRRLRVLGWDDAIMDESTFGLLRSVVETASGADAMQGPDTIERLV